MSALNFSDSEVSITEQDSPTILRRPLTCARTEYIDLRPQLQEPSVIQLTDVIYDPPKGVKLTPLGKDEKLYRVSGTVPYFGAPGRGRRSWWSVSRLSGMTFLTAILTSLLFIF